MTKNKWKWFILGGIFVIIAYLIVIGVYTRLSSDPIIFFASLLFAVFISVITCILISKISKKLFDSFTLVTIGMVYFFGIILLTVFGPTFVDRSISYHIAFYAVEEEKVYIDKIEKSFSTEIFNKRIHDAIETGFLIENEEGYFEPTLKSKIMYYTLKPLGDITGSMDTYYKMKEELSGDQEE